MDDFIKDKTTILLWGVMILLKIVFGYSEERKKLGWQPEFKKFQLRVLWNSRRRLIGGGNEPLLGPTILGRISSMKIVFNIVYIRVCILAFTREWANILSTFFYLYKGSFKYYSVSKTFSNIHKLEFRTSNSFYQKRFKKQEILALFGKGLFLFLSFEMIVSSGRYYRNRFVYFV